MTEAEGEEEAKRAAAAMRDLKEAAARSKAAKDLRESAEAAKREADELEADAARMEAEAEAEDDTEPRDGDGEAEESTPADPTEAYKKLKASREEALVETGGRGGGECWPRARSSPRTPRVRRAACRR